ncbi:MAG: ATP-binding cassette domain-containing protein [Mesorhizobium sp.]|nr:MAG: ATP-binding cassette domain-containing protein [Mesorhizobium sp.]
MDLERVRNAAQQAALAGFIENLPKGYETRVGERGVRLSGGQRQRIGIARAFYKQASLLVFDEATSALDNETEAAVMEAIGDLPADLTVLIIAHRLTTVENCDEIVTIEDGQPHIA